MSVRPIIDAGPGLNFLSIHKERLLIAILGPFSAPETVQSEVLRKSQQDDRFRATATVWRKLTPRWIQILPDDATRCRWVCRRRRCRCRGRARGSARGLCR